MGVILAPMPRAARATGIPHVSGGDPELVAQADRAARYSPRKWG